MNSRLNTAASPPSFNPPSLPPPLPPTRSNIPSTDNLVAPAIKVSSTELARSKARGSSHRPAAGPPQARRSITKRKIKNQSPRTYATIAAGPPAAKVVPEASPEPVKLCLSLLKQLEKENSESVVHDTAHGFVLPSSVLTPVTPVLASTPEMSTNFLLSVKKQVAQMSRPTKKRKLGALELAELRFEQGAMLSASSSDSDAIDDEDDELHSVNSNGATVAGRISPEKARKSLKAKLRREGNSESFVKYEMACHMSAAEMRHQQKQRRSRTNEFAMRFRQQQLLLKRKQEQNAAKPSGLVKPTPVEKNNLTDAQCKWTPKFTRDQKIVACRRRRAITNELVELQKKRDRGEVTVVGFEEAKANVFHKIFGTDKDGNITIRKSEWTGSSTGAVDNFDKYGGWLQQSRKRHRTVDATAETDVDLDYMNETERERKRNASEHESDDFDDDEIVGVEILMNRFDDFCLDQTKDGLPVPLDKKQFTSEQFQAMRRVAAHRQIHLETNRMRHKQRRICRESENRVRNLERRQMLMRRFDQRAPPEQRMFKQDTSLTLDGGPTLEQKQDWAFWYTPIPQLPDWMKAVKKNRQIIFPDDIKKI